VQCDSGAAVLNRWLSLCRHLCSFKQVQRLYGVILFGLFKNNTVNTGRFIEIVLANFG
jgi:hypothetical protein